MKLLYRLLLLLVVVAMVAIGILFTLQNTQSVPLDLLVYQLPPQSVSLWVLGSFALGGLVGMLVSAAIILRLRAALARANRQLGKVRAELDRLRGADSGADSGAGSEGGG